MSLHQPDHLLDAFTDLERSLRANQERAQAMTDRIAHIRAQRLVGKPYAEIVSAEQRPLIVELLTESVRDLEGAGVQVRRHEARSLRREGLTMDAIAELFGVSRQRVSVLLREREGSER